MLPNNLLVGVSDYSKPKFNVSFVSMAYDLYYTDLDRPEWLHKKPRERDALMLFTIPAQQNGRPGYASISLRCSTPNLSPSNFIILVRWNI